MKNIFVSGSLAFDRVKTYPGQFSDLLLPEHLSHLSVSIVVDSLVQHDGGVAANIAFSLAQLGERAIIVSAAGSDFEEYKKRLATFADVSKIVINEKELTAAADIVTDSAQNQITTFFPGALHTPCFVDVSMADLVLVSAGNRDDMVRLPIECRTKNIPYFFDPGQMTSVLTGDELSSGISGARALFVNEYEWNLIEKKTGFTKNAILEHVRILVVTYGKDGSSVCTQQEETHVDAIAANAVDPSGAGDAYRAGFAFGFVHELTLQVCAQLGACTAAFAVEKDGMQNHAFSMDAFWKRYEAAYGARPILRNSKSSYPWPDRLNPK